MEKLPVELIEKICMSNILSLQDVINLSLTSKHFQDIIINNNTLWKHRFFQKYPELVNKLEDKPNSYYHELHHIHQLKKRSRALLEDLAQKCYKKVELSKDDLKGWEVIIKEKWDNYFYLVMDLLDIIYTECDIHTDNLIPLNVAGNLTQRYYAGKVIAFIRQMYIGRLWDQYLNTPVEQRLMENGAILVAQWCQPTMEIEPEIIHRSLDELAEKVKNELRAVVPDHPIFKTSKEQFALWKATVRPENEWSPKDSQILIKVINEVLFGQLAFVSYVEQTTHASVPDESYSFIDVVLKTRYGMLTILAIIYEAVARRLGLRCEPIFFSSHFFLRFCESQDPNADWYYIDISRGGQIVQKGSCPFSRTVSPSPKPRRPGCPPEKVIIQVVRDLESSARRSYSPSASITSLRSTLELVQLTNPTDFRSLINLATLYIQHNFNKDALNPMKNAVKNALETSSFDSQDDALRLAEMIRSYNPDPFDDRIKPVRRPKDQSVKFAVGMVMGHKLMEYRCVIFNWDTKCMAAAQWKQMNNINRLTYKDNQPFYNVLAEDGSHRYVAQENLLLIYVPQGLELEVEVGRYFSHYFETYYVPNAQTEQHYPEDGPVRIHYHEIVKNMSLQQE